MVAIPLKLRLEIMDEGEKCCKLIDEHPDDFTLCGERVCEKVCKLWTQANDWDIHPGTLPDSDKIKSSKLSSSEWAEYLKKTKGLQECDAVFTRGPDTRFVDYKFKGNTIRGIAMAYGYKPNGEPKEYTKYWEWVQKGHYPDVWLFIWSHNEQNLYIHKVQNPSDFKDADYLPYEAYEIKPFCIKTRIFPPPIKRPKSLSSRTYWAWFHMLQTEAAKGNWEPVDLSSEDYEWADKKWKGLIEDFGLMRLSFDKIEKIQGAYVRILRPKHPQKRFKDVAIFGFDLEWNPKTDMLLSVQIVGPTKSKFRTENLKGYNGERLLSDVSTFQLVERNFLIAHFSTADIGHLKDCFRDFKFKPVNRALHATFVKTDESDSSGFNTKPLEIDGCKFKIIDLYAYLPYSLKKIGDMIGLPKLEADRVNILEFKNQNSKAFRAYALRDAEICLKTFNLLREMLWKDWNVEILKCPTIASIAAEIFRTRFLKEPITPYKIRTTVTNVKTKHGHRKRRNRRYVYTGSKDVRDLALMAYWGGRAESFIHGFIKGQFRYYDVVSLFPSAAMLQPLPNKDTEWYQFTNIDDTQRLEGYARVEFQFPDNCKYPCLPVHGEIYNRLYFPLSGLSYCTLSEVREALRFGCKFKKIDGYGFRPGPNEIDHPLRTYMEEMLKRKNESSGLTRDFYKLLMNALIGKLVQRTCDQNLTFQQAYYVHHGVPLNKALRYKGPEKVGPMWAPEWAALILGRARAIMSQWISKGALMSVTDSVLLPANVNIECSALDELRSVGSDLVQEYDDIEAAFLIRTRLYALFNGAKEIVKEAHHAVHLTKDQVKVIIQKALEIGADPEIVETRDHIIKFGESLRTGKPLGHSEPKESRIYFRWDFKRNLLNPNLNMFREYSDSEALKDAESHELRLWHATKIKHGRPRKSRGKPGRPRGVSPETERKIVELRKQGKSYRAIAKELDVSLGMVQRVIKRYYDSLLKGFKL